MNRSSGASAFYEGIDFIRAGAVFLVLWSHGGSLVPVQSHSLLYSSFFRPGFWGVTLFFSISGFLIIGQLLDMDRGLRNESLRVFVLRRCLRTMPTYWLATALVLILGFATWPGTLAFVANLLFVQDLASLGSVLPVAWSLVIEVWSYMLYAFLAWLSCRSVRVLRLLKRWWPGVCSGDDLLVVALFVLPIVASLIRYDLAAQEVSVQQIKQGLFSQLDALVYGGLLAWFQRSRQPLFDRLTRQPWLAPLCLLLMALTTASVPYLFVNVQSPPPIASAAWLAFGFYPCVGLLASLFLLSLWNFRYAWLPFHFDVPCRWLSRCSYSVYLLHLSVASLLAPLGVGLVPFLLYLVLSILVGVLGWKWMERPFTRLRYVL